MSDELDDDGDDAPPIDWDGCAWRKATHKDIPALVAQWVDRALTDLLDAREWSDAERTEIMARARPIYYAYYAGFFTGALGPPADPTPPRLH